MAVYTDVTDEELAAFVARYDIGEIRSRKGIQEGVENSNFLLVTDRGPHILTLYEKRTRREDLPFFLGLMEHLSRRGIDCPVPIHDRDGVALGELAGRAAVIVSFLNGGWPRHIQPFHCAQLGAAQARMHLAAADFDMSRTNDLSLSGWEALADRCRGRADEVTPGLARIIDDELEHLRAVWPSDLPSGVIHADLFPDNVFFQDDRLTGLIDFYFACSDAFAYDAAICLNAWCFEPSGEFNATKARFFLSNYNAVRPLSVAETRALPILCRGSALRFMLTRLYDWLNRPPNAFVKVKDPLEYLGKLRFHRETRGVESYGLEPVA